MKKTVYTALCMAIFSVCAAVTALSVPALAAFGKITELSITNNPEYTAVFSADGDRIIAEGRFADDKPVEIGFVDIDSKNYDKCSISIETDGSFIAAVTYRPFEPTVSYVYLKLKSGAMLPYYVYYKDGWFFPDNGLSHSNRAVLDNITDAAPLASAYYISATADELEIADTLYRLQKIVGETTDGVTDDYEKARLLCKWVAEHIYYDHDAANAGIDISTVSISNVLTIKRTTCAGFANTYAALLETAGIRAVNIKGSAAAGGVTFETLATGVENHEWTAFWYEDENRWVFADSCWNSGNDYVFGGYTKGHGTERYFDPDDVSFSLNHRCDKSEQRNYLGALAAIGSELLPAPYPTSESETTPPEIEIPTQETEPAITIPVVTTTPDAETQLPETTTQQTEPQESGKNAGITPVLWLIVVLIGLGIVAAAIFLINKRRKNK